MNTFIIIKQTNKTLTNSHSYTDQQVFKKVQAQYHRGSIPSDSKSCSKIYYKKLKVKKGGLKLFILLASNNGNNIIFFIKLRQEFCYGVLE